jgi:hypothetical protein
MDKDQKHERKEIENETSEDGITKKTGDELESSERTDKEILNQAKERFQTVVDANSSERELQRADARFADEDQWEPEIRNARENAPNGSRPVLTIDKINQYISQIVNDLRQNKPAIKVKPIDNDADVKTAQVFQAIIRHIEEGSNAGLAYLIAGESAVKVGEGYFMLRTDFVDEMSFDQEVQFVPIYDYSKVYLGAHDMPDGSDAKYSFIIEDVPNDQFKREYPNAKVGSSTEFSDAVSSNEALAWRNEDSTRIALYHYIDYKDTELFALEDGSTMLKDDYIKLAESDAHIVPGVIDRRPTQTESVKWVKMTGAEIIERGEWLGKNIPIIKVVGKASNVNGRKHFKGLVRLAKDSLRAYNYWFSALTEKLALAPKAPFIGAVGQFDTDRDKWQKANTENYAFLQYDVIDANGAALGSPQRQQAAPMESGMIAHLQLIEHDIKTSLGMFKANTGEQSAQQSGKAINSLRTQGETGSFHFPDNVAMSIRCAGLQLIDVIPKLYDTRRIVRIMGEDGGIENVEVDPNQEESRKDVDGIQSIYNLRVGKYDVTAVPGASYATKRMEQSEILMQFVQNSPEQLSMFGDLLFKMQDYPLAAEISERFEKMLPPGIKPAKEGELPPEIQQMLAEIEQQKEQLEQKAQALNEAEYEINEIRTKVGKATVEAMGKEERVKVELGRVEVLKQELGLMEREMKLQNPNADADAKIKIAAMQQETQYVLGVMEGELKEKSELLKIQQDSMKETKQIDTSKLETQIAALEKKIAMQDNSKNEMNPMAETMSGIKDILAQMQKPKKIKKNLKAGVNKSD